MSPSAKVVAALGQHAFETCLINLETDDVSTILQNATPRCMVMLGGLRGGYT
jgi:hypothetical protein